MAFPAHMLASINFFQHFLSAALPMVSFHETVARPHYLPWWHVVRLGLAQGSVDDIPSLQIDWTKAGLGYQRDIAMKNAEGWVEVEGIPVEGKK